MLGLIAAWLDGVFEVKTRDGVIVLENVPKDSEIRVDDNKINFTWPGAGKPLEIRAVPGEHRIEVRKDGFKTFGEVATVKTDESEEVTVRLEPVVAHRQGKTKEDTPQARGSEHPRPTRETGSSRADVTGGVPTNAVETFARTRVDKPPTPRAALPLNLAKKTSVSLTRIVHVDGFNGPQHGLLKDLNIPHDPNHGRSDGVFFVYSPGGWSAWNLHAIRSEGTCEVIARVLSENLCKTAAWTVSVVNQVDSERGFLIKINVKGELFLEPSPWPKAAAFRQIDPKRGPITHTAIKPGIEFNKLLLIMRNREVVIFVNGIQVCDPVRFSYDITPSVLAVGVAGPGRKRAEFDRLEIRENM